jgi:hypothetical protein
MGMTDPRRQESRKLGRFFSSDDVMTAPAPQSQAHLAAHLAAIASRGAASASQAASASFAGAPYSARRILVALGGFMAGLMLMVALLVGYRFTETRFTNLRKIRK